MRVLFLVPPRELNQEKAAVDRVYGCNYGFDYKPPIHLLALATTAKNSGHASELLDCPAQGYDLRKLAGYLALNPCDAVVFWSVWLSGREDLAAAGIIRSKFSRCDIIFAGPYPSWRPQLFLTDSHCLVVRGEPEAALTDLLAARQAAADLSGVGNLSYRYGVKIVHNHGRRLIDIDTLPIPDRSLLKGRYSFNRIRRQPATVACFSRGCSYRCSYCAPHSLDQAIEIESLRQDEGKPRLRLRSVDNVVAEFQKLRAQGFRGIEICDNQFVWDKLRTLEIASGISSLGLEWICYARADHLKDPGMLDAMHKAGCRLIYIGTESFSQEILDDIGKEMQISTIREAVTAVRKAGIEPEVSVLLGASGLETEETIHKSIREARKLKTEFVHYSIACPLPNTRLYKIAKEKGWLKSADFVPADNIRHAALDLPGITARRLEELTRNCYAAQYFSPGFIFRQIATGRILNSPASRIRSLVRLLKYIGEPGQKPLKIAVIGTRGIPARYSGVEKQAEELAVRLAGKGHAVTVYCRKTKIKPAVPVYEGIRLVFIPTINSKHLGTPVHVFLCTLHAIFSDARILHFHALGPSAFAFLPRIFGKKVVVTVHALDWQRRKWGGLARAFLKACEYPAVFSAHKTIVVSFALKDYFERRFGRKVHFIPSGVDPSLSGAASVETGKSGYILFTGRLVPEKGLDILIRAFNQIPGDKKLMIAGEASFTKGYERKLRLMAGKNVEFLGFVPEDRMRSLYAGAYLFVLPSEVEGLSLALLEAMNQGRCCLVSDIPHSRDVVGDCGVCFKTGDCEDLKVKLSLLLNDPGLVSEFGARAKERVRRLYNWDRIASETETLYSSL